MPSSIPYPKLSSVVKIEDLPEQLNFVKNGLHNVLDKIYFKDLIFAQKEYGGGKFYTITLIKYKRLGIDIPGTGFSIVLNPAPVGANDTGESLIPVSCSYDLPILNFIKEFKVSNFSFGNDAVYYLINKLFAIDYTELVLSAVDNFIDAATPYNSFIDQLNSFYNLTGGSALPYPASTNPEIAANEIVTSINSNAVLLSQDVDSPKAIYSGFIQNADAGITGDNLNALFFKRLGKSSHQFVRDLLIPKINATLFLSLGLEIPRNVFVPLDSVTLEPLPVNDPNNPPKTILSFAQSYLNFSTEAGIGFDTDTSLTLLPQYSRIGNTPLMIGFTQAKLDLSRKTNIPEADRDGRPQDFIGVYIQEATIGFPQFWNHDTNSTALIKGRNLLIGTGGISGFISLESSQPNGKALFKLGHTAGGKHFELGIEQFLIEFKQGAIVQSEISGYMKIPGFKDTNGADAEINVLVHIGNNGDFRITASEADGIPVIGIQDIFQLTLRSVSIGRDNDKWYIEASGSLLITAEIPHVTTDFLQCPIDIKKLRIYQDGSIEFVGGGIALPRHIAINIGPVSLAMDNISFSSHEGFFN